LFFWHFSEMKGDTPNVGFDDKRAPVTMRAEVRQVPSSNLVPADSISVNGLADTEGDQNQRNGHQHPTGVEAARPPKVTESAKQKEAADEYAGREPRVPLQPSSGGDQSQSAEEPADRTEMQQQRHQPSDGYAYSPVGERQFRKRPDHQSLNEDAVDHGRAASYHPGHCQRSVLPIHDHTPLYGN
jgi:hypothetical protein